MRALRHAALWIPLACVLHGCGSAVCPGTTLPEASVLWGATAPRSMLQSLRAEASVDQRGPEGRIKGRVMMFVQRPDRVRFDAMTQFGPVAILTSDGERFALTELKEKRFTAGVSCPRNIGRMLGVELSAREVLGLMLAELPSGDAAYEPLGCREGVLSVRHQAADGVLVAQFSAGGEHDPPRLVGVTRQDAAGKSSWSVEYEDYREIAPSFVLPQVVRLHDLRNDSQLLIRFKEMTVNVNVPEGAFQQQARPGLAVEEVGCQ